MSCFSEEGAKIIIREIENGHAKDSSTTLREVCKEDLKAELDVKKKVKSSGGDNRKICIIRVPVGRRKLVSLTRLLSRKGNSSVDKSLLGGAARELVCGQPAVSDDVDLVALKKASN